ncbi:hypothetical protein GGR58DRAFT_526710 [Xylaria digitata]|nr:hypothetical protein GGR58DRAFT_526710 [Xylaria digitata]
MASPDHSPANTFVGRVRGIYHLIGFTKGYNFVLWVTCTGILLGFSLYRLQFLDFHGVFCSGAVKSKFNHAAPGECFYFLQQPYKMGVILHLAGILPAAILACIQFVPAFRHKAVSLHRINGHIVTIMSVVSIAGVFVILPRSFGGGFGVQVVGGVLAVSFLWALHMAYINIKRLRIEQHRAWMLRAWYWAGSIITQRIIHIVSLKLLNSNPSYYAMPCDKIDSMLGTRTLDLYPRCTRFYSGEDPQTTAVVRADLNHPTSVVEAAAALDSTFARTTFLAFLLHILGVEIYLRLTQGETERLRNISHKRQLSTSMENLGESAPTDYPYLSTTQNTQNRGFFEASRT